MTMSDLDNAFRELERRADASDDALGPLHRPQTRRGARPLLIGVSVAAVAAVAVVGVGLAASGSSPRQVAGSAPGGSPTFASATSTPTAAGELPKDQAELTERFRSVLGDTATFTVDRDNSTSSLITGVLTSAAGDRGLYVLEVSKTGGDPDGAGNSIPAFQCGTSAGVHDVGGANASRTSVACGKTTTLSDGSTLQVDPAYADGPVDGLMNDAIRTRPDGWQISLYTANVESKTYGAPLLGTQPPLTTEQVTDVVTSPEWN